MGATDSQMFVKASDSALDAFQLELLQVESFNVAESSAYLADNVLGIVEIGGILDSNDFADAGH